MRDPRPGVIVVSEDGDEVFNWLSDGWYSSSMGTRGTRMAERLMNKACAAIEAADDIPDAISRLEKAGFKVTRSER